MRTSTSASPIAVPAAILIVLATGACAPRMADEAAPGTGPPSQTSSTGYARDLPPAEFEEFLRLRGDVFVLDVRQALDWDGPLGHLDQAVLIPVEELEARIAELPLSRERPIAVYDRAGVRTAGAARILLSHGYREVVTLMGGLEAYRREKF